MNKETTEAGDATATAGLLAPGAGNFRGLYVANLGAKDASSRHLVQPKMDGLGQRWCNTMTYHGSIEETCLNLVFPLHPMRYNLCQINGSAEFLPIVLLMTSPVAPSVQCLSSK